MYVYVIPLSINIDIIPKENSITEKNVNEVTLISEAIIIQLVLKLLTRKTNRFAITVINRVRVVRELLIILGVSSILNIGGKIHFIDIP